MNSEFAIRFQISENVSVMLNFSVNRHFGKLTVNEGFCAVLAVVCGVIFRSGHTILHLSVVNSKKGPDLSEPKWPAKQLRLEN